MNDARAQRQLKDVTNSLLPLLTSGALGTRKTPQATLFKSYLDYDLTSLEKFSEHPQFVQFEYAADYIVNSDLIAAAVIAPIERAVEDGIRPTYQDIIKISALE